MLSTDILEGWKSYNGGPPCGRKFQICLPYNLFSVDWFTGVNWTFIIKPKTIHLNFDGSVHSSFGKNRKDSPRRYHKQISLKFSMSSYVVFSHLHNRKTNSHKTRNPFFENAKMWKPFRWKSHTQKNTPQPWWKCFANPCGLKRLRCNNILAFAALSCPPRCRLALHRNYVKGLVSWNFQRVGFVSRIIEELFVISGLRTWKLLSH